MKNTVYYRQAELLLRILPIVNTETAFALKGGTAINFFVRDLPRLSVDIDLTYLPVNNREEALEGIHKSLLAVSDKVISAFPDTQVMPRVQEIHSPGSPKSLTRLIVRRGDATIKIEPSLVLRGCIFAPEVRSLSEKAQALFETAVSVKTLSLAELYGGKMCAALDRQHPRDLFDLMFLAERGGMEDDTRKAFIVHLISHPRPMVELLDPHFADVREIYEKDLKGMTFQKVEFSDLIQARSRLVSMIRRVLTREERRFILSIKAGDPEWGLIGLKGIENLPAVKWKILNIKKMTPKKHKKAFDKLKACLDATMP